MGIIRILKSSVLPAMAGFRDYRVLNSFKHFKHGILRKIKLAESESFIFFGIVRYHTLS